MFTCMNMIENICDILDFCTFLSLSHVIGLVLPTFLCYLEEICIIYHNSFTAHENMVWHLDMFENRKSCWCFQFVNTVLTLNRCMLVGLPSSQGFVFEEKRSGFLRTDVNRSDSFGAGTLRWQISRLSSLPRNKEQFPGIAGDWGNHFVTRLWGNGRLEKKKSPYQFSLFTTSFPYNRYSIMLTMGQCHYCPQLTSER